MNWFLAKLIFIIEQEGNASYIQFDEQLRLVQAPCLQDALEKATTIARQEEQEFLDSDNKKIAWKLIGIPELQAIGQLEDGKEIYSWSPESEDATGYIEYIQKKQCGLLERLSRMPKPV